MLRDHLEKIVKKNEHINSYTPLKNLKIKTDRPPLEQYLHSIKGSRTKANSLLENSRLSNQHQSL